MSDFNLDPLNVPNEWHRYLYRSVLLPWETVLKRSKTFPRFDGRKPLHGISLIKVDALKDFDQTNKQHNGDQTAKELFVFYCSEGAALKDVLALLRNCVAHGHYSSPRSGWIVFHHVYKGKTKFSGQAKISSLKKLVDHITGGASS